MARYSAKYKHRLVGLDSGKETVLGDLLSFDDHDLGDAALPNRLFAKTVHRKDFPSLDEGDAETFFLGFKPEKEENSLASQPSLLLTVCSQQDKALYGLTKGFLGHVVGRKRRKTEKEMMVAAEQEQEENPHFAFIPQPLPSTAAPIADTAHSAESHYNDLVRQKERRHLSFIYHLRCWNNLLKSEALISAAAMVARARGRDGLRVLDLACGKGGDLMKWLRLPGVDGGEGLADYVGVDIAQGSLKDFVQRLQGRSVKERRKISMLIAADLGIASLRSSRLPTFSWTTPSSDTRRKSQQMEAAEEGGWADRIPFDGQSPRTEYFDLVSCQFAMHYLFASVQTARHFLSEVSTALRPGGIFLATTIDCRVLAQLLLEARHGRVALDDDEEHEEENGRRPYLSVDWLDGGARMTFQNDLGHRLLTINLPPKTVDHLLGNSGSKAQTDPEEVCGLLYTFTLHDSSSEAAVDAPEYIVPLGAPLQHLLEEAHLKLRECTNFHPLYSKMCQEKGNARWLDRLREMNVINRRGTISQAEWAIARLYMLVVVEKDGPQNEVRSVPLPAASVQGRMADYDPLIVTPSSPTPPPPLSSSGSRNSMFDGESVMEPQFPPPPATTSPRETAPRLWYPSFLETGLTVVQGSTDSQWKMLARSLAFMQTVFPGLPVEYEEKQLGQEHQQNGEAVEEDDEQARYLAEHALAIELAGGEDQWDMLDEDAQNDLLGRAGRALRLRATSSTST
eukprot:scaffold6531_cov169-Ochromonas_danica.AAC.15